MPSTGAERSVEELKLMTTPELAWEGRRACRGVLDNAQSAGQYRDMARRSRNMSLYDKARASSNEAERERRYLERIGFVLRDRQHGQMPAWFERFGRAIDSEDWAECDTAATAGGWRPKQ